MSDMPRRRFLAGAGAALAGLGINFAHAGVARADQHWDETFDVIIVGAGLAGLTAACAALDEGAKTVLLEKMSVSGGTGNYSNGTFSVVGSPQQAAAGIKDDWKILMEDNMREGGGWCRPELARHVAEQSHASYEFAIAHGATFEDYLIPFPGHSVKRLLQPTKNCEVGFLQPFRRYVKEHGGEIRTRVRVDEILFNDAGEVVGVKARTNYRFDPTLESDDLENKTGTVKYYRALRGIVCATGGWAHDKVFLEQECPQFAQTFSTQHIGSTASGYRLLANAGARMIQTAFYRAAFPEANNMGKGVIVDVTTGKRYISETKDRRTQFEAANIQMLKTGRIPVSILDKEAYEHVVNMPHFNVNRAAGWVTEHPSIEDVAEHYEIPLEPLKETIARYNADVEKGVDTEFGSDLEKKFKNPIDHAPYYVCWVRPDLNANTGGALITPKAEVVGLNTNKPIPGLYAAGKATGGVHGYSRLLGAAVADCVVFGMTAGREVARRKPAA